MKNTMNGFSRGMLRNGQNRRIRYIYGTSWYGNWFLNATKTEQWSTIIYLSVSSSSSSLAAATRLLHKNNSNSGSVGINVEEKIGRKEGVPNPLAAVDTAPQGDTVMQ